MKTGIVVLTGASKTKIASEVIPFEKAVEKARAFQSGAEKADGFDGVEVWSGATRRFLLPKPAAAETVTPAK